MCSALPFSLPDVPVDAVLNCSTVSLHIWRTVEGVILHTIAVRLTDYYRIPHNPGVWREIPLSTPVYTLHKPRPPDCVDGWPHQGVVLLWPVFVLAQGRGGHTHTRARALLLWLVSLGATHTHTHTLSLSLSLSRMPPASICHFFVKS